MARVWRSISGQRGTAWLAVAVLFAHTLIMGFHVPPSLRTALAEAERAALLAGVCHADPETAVQPTGHGGDHGDHRGPGGPAHPVDHLSHCPICLSLAGGLLGPAEAPSLPRPTLVVRAEPLPVAFGPWRSFEENPFAARAPPATV